MPSSETSAPMQGTKELCISDSGVKWMIGAIPALLHRIARDQMNKQKNDGDNQPDDGQRTQQAKENGFHRWIHDTR